MTRPVNRRWLLLGIAALALPALGACGKRGRVRLPDEKAGQATYPRRYPAPSSVNPGAVSSGGAPAPEPVTPTEPGADDPYYDPFAEQDEADETRESVIQ